MRTIIAGSRTITDYNIVKEAIEKSGFEITTILCGMAKGVDQLGKRYGEEKEIPIEKFPANWEIYGKMAGYFRNEQMGRNADALIAIWDGESKGTKQMIGIARLLKLKVFVYKV
jgi:hypothetical protein